MSPAQATPDTPGLCVRLPDRDRLTLPPPACRGQTFWLTAVGERWLEMTTDADAANLAACVTLGNKNRFLLPRGYLRFQFAVRDEDTLISVVTVRGPTLTALVFGLEYLPGRDGTRVPDLVVAETLHRPRSSSPTHLADSGRGNADRGHPCW